MRAKRLQRNMVLAQQTLRRVEGAERRDAWHARIHADLAARGIAPELCDSITAELSAHARFETLTAEAYDAMIEGAVLACGAHEGEVADAPAVLPENDDPAQVREMERMMQAFAGELRKLDESLEVLSAYVQRMRKQKPRKEVSETPAPSRGRHTLH